MKLFGNTGKRYKEKKKSGRGRRVLRGLLIALLVIGALAGGAYAWFLSYIEPPPVAEMTPAPQQTPETETTPEVDEPEVTALPGRRPDVYTILVAGEDDDNGGTDVIMVGLFDTVERTLDVVSIPRDTVVNVPWGVKKINSYKNMYTYLEQDYDNYVEALKDGVEMLVGFEIDAYITINLESFVELVDIIGGVEFDVPVRMYYEDPTQNLHIDLQPGPQTLDGEKAMGVVRYRSYTDGDIQRIKVQQDFLSALASQILRLQNLWNISDMVKVFQEHVDTDLNLKNLGFFANEFLKMSSSDITFHAVDGDIANIYDEVRDTSYVTLYVDKWLELVNSTINPYTWPITESDVEILTRSPATGGFYTTRGTYYENWA